MAGKRKTPKLRRDGKYYVATIYKPNGQRSNVSFGPAGTSRGIGSGVMAKARITKSFLYTSGRL